MPSQVSVIGSSDLSDLYSNWVFQSGCVGFDVRLSIQTNQMLPSSTHTAPLGSPSRESRRMCLLLKRWILQSVVSRNVIQLDQHGLVELSIGANTICSFDARPKQGNVNSSHAAATYCTYASTGRGLSLSKCLQPPFQVPWIFKIRGNS